MPQRKNTREPGMLTAQNASDHRYAPLMSVDRIEPEVQSLTDESVSLNGTAQGVMTHLSLRIGSNSRTILCLRNCMGVYDELLQ
jgi:hypothetical protein